MSDEGGRHTEIIVFGEELLRRGANGTLRVTIGLAIGAICMAVDAIGSHIDKGKNNEMTGQSDCSRRGGGHREGGLGWRVLLRAARLACAHHLGARMAPAPPRNGCGPSDSRQPRKALR